MEEEEEKSKGFKVEDRRRFSAEGDLKPEHRGGEAPQPAPPPSSPSSEQPLDQKSAAVMSGNDAQQAGDAGGDISFASFMVGISTQALVHLGEIPDPNGEPAAISLPAAQQLIDIVGMLKDKTRGNLDSDEQGLIDAILFELRMKYVEKSR